MKRTASNCQQFWSASWVSAFFSIAQASHSEFGHIQLATNAGSYLACSAEDILFKLPPVLYWHLKKRKVIGFVTWNFWSDQDWYEHLIPKVRKFQLQYQGWFSLPVSYWGTDALVQDSVRCHHTQINAKPVLASCSAVILHRCNPDVAEVQRNQRNSNQLEVADLSYNNYIFKSSLYFLVPLLFVNVWQTNALSLLSCTFESWVHFCFIRNCEQHWVIMQTLVERQ